LLIVGADVIVSGCHYGVIKVWNFDAAASRFVLKQTLNGHARGISGLIMVDKLLWSSSLDGSIRLWDIEKGECQYVITKNTKAKDGQATVGHVGAVTGLLLCPMPGAGTFVLSSSLDGTIKAWNGANGECVVSHEHQAGVVSMALSQDKSQHPIILIGLDNGNIMIRNLVQTQKAPAFALILTLSSYFSVGHSGAVRSVAEGPHQTFYTGGQDGQLLVLQITDDLGI
jgi:WD40 repeat protein